MELFIQIKDGKPLDHPISGENIEQAFPNVDLNNLPDWLARFIRVPPPSLGVYEVYEGVTYDRVNDSFTDTHHVRQMTDAEKLEKQNSVKAYWENIGFSSWTFNNETCEFDPPVPYPTDGKHYRWNESSTSWIAIGQIETDPV